MSVRTTPSARFIGRTLATSISVDFLPVSGLTSGFGQLTVPDVIERSSKRVVMQHVPGRTALCDYWTTTGFPAARNYRCLLAPMCLSTNSSILRLATLINPEVAPSVMARSNKCPQGTVHLFSQSNFSFLKAVKRSDPIDID